VSKFTYHGHEGKLAMKDLFDFIAGTSTGSIIAASLAMPKNESVNGKTVLSKTEPLYFADEII
jgi:patatin-like phospholipase/acyl hydrolase